MRVYLDQAVVIPLRRWHRQIFFVYSVLAYVSNTSCSNPYLRLSWPVRQGEIDVTSRSHAQISGGNRFLCWIVDPGSAVAADCRPILLAQLLSAPIAIYMGAINGLIVSLAAASYLRSPWFLLFSLTEVFVLALRIRVTRRIAREQAQGAIPTIDHSVILSIAWCLLQGSIAFAIMLRGEAVVMILAVMMLMGLVGPILARNYASPRLAMLLVCLIDIPCVLGSVLSGYRLLLVFVVMTPPFLLGARQIVRSFQDVLITTLMLEAYNRSLARHDALTGLLNRFGLEDALGTLPSATDSTMAVLCIDLDGFKSINDTYGHAAGDGILEGVARRLTESARASDLIARLGGDEFMIVIRNLRVEDVARIADRLIETIAGEPYLLPAGRMGRIGASIGFACFPEDASTTTELRILADQALYAAKGDGKGCGRRCTSPVRPLATTG